MELDLNLIFWVILGGYIVISGVVVICYLKQVNKIRLYTDIVNNACNMLSETTYNYKVEVEKSFKSLDEKTAGLCGNVDTLVKDLLDRQKQEKPKNIVLKEDTKKITEKLLKKNYRVADFLTLTPSQKMELRGFVKDKSKSKRR